MTRYVVVLYLVTLCFYGAICALWLLGQHAAYYEFLRALGVQPWQQPFLDLRGALSWGECHRRGIDVLATNPCDPLNRLLNYTPLLLVLPLHAADSVVGGLVQDTAFLIAVPLVLRPRSLEELALAIIACLSTVTIYALERANLDVLIFFLLALTGLLSARRRIGRGVAYTVYFLGGALKIYPFALLIIVARETPRVALALGALFIVLIAFFFAYYWSDFEIIASLLPPIEMDASDIYSAYRFDNFSAYLLPMWLAAWSSHPAAGPLLFLALVAGSGAFSLWLAHRILSITTGTDWDHRIFYFALIGSIVLTGCFFAQSNMTYRVVFALFLIPGLVELRSRADHGWLKRLFSAAVWLTLWCMWREMFGSWLEKLLATVDHSASGGASVRLPAVGFFAVRELVWWFLVSVMLAIVLAFVLASPLGQAANAAIHQHFKYGRKCRVLISRAS